MVKVTFTVDEETVDTLRRVASRLRKPQSAVFREAIRQFAQHADRLGDDERQRMLSILDRVRKRRPARSDADVDKEIADIRSARRKGGRGTPVK